YWCCSCRSTSGGSARTAGSRGRCERGAGAMSWEDAGKDMAAYQAELDKQLASGADRKIAEGRARSKAIRAYLAEHPEEAHEAAPRPAAAAAAPAAAPAGGAPAAAAAVAAPAA